MQMVRFHTCGEAVHCTLPVSSLNPQKEDEEAKAEQRAHCSEPESRPNRGRKALVRQSNYVRWNESRKKFPVAIARANFPRSPLSKFLQICSF
jgi:hypothetical protein